MKSPLKIAICDDEREEAERLRGLVVAADPTVEVALFEEGESFLAAHSSRRFNLVFLDIYMGGATGIETARALRETDKQCQIAFITKSSDHALDGYSVDAMQYLVKPDGLTQQAIEAIMERAGRIFSAAASEVCSLVVGGKRRDILMSDILYAEAQDKECHIRMKSEGGTELIVTTMKFDALCAMLPPPRFYRCHRSYIVNLEHIAKIQEDIIMVNGDTVYMRRGSRTKCELAQNEWHLAQAARRHDEMM